MAHDVIAILVSYDADNFWANTVPDQSYENVLKTRRAVCEGYANVYKKFCDTLGIKCEKVTGYARGVGYDISQAENPADSNHAWNIVRLDGEWYLVDVTWDSGYMNGKKSVQAYTTDYLFTMPFAFLHSHYPEKQTHQLMKTPLSKSEFCNLPHLRPKYFYIAENPSIKIGMKNSVENSFVLDYDSNENFMLKFVVRNASNKEIKNCTFQESTDKRTKTIINLPKAGLYKVSVFVFKTGKNSGDGIGDFFIESSADNNELFPEIYAIDNSQILVSPKTMPLEKGKSYKFMIYAPKKNFAAIIIGKSFTQMTKTEDGYFTLDFEIPVTAKTLTIGTALKERGSYESFATYTVK